jgi:hypothetical protein
MEMRYQEFLPKLIYSFNVRIADADPVVGKFL